MVKIIWLFFLVFVLSAMHVSAQDKTALDTLYKQSRSTNLDVKVKALNELCRIFTGIDNKKAMDLAQEALLVSRNGKNTSLIAQSQNRLGTIYDYRGVTDSANMNFLASLKLFEKLKDKGGIASVYQNIGVMNYFQGDMDKALQYYEKAIKLRIETNELDFVAKLHNNIAIIYRRQKNYDKAIDYHNRALAIKIKFKDKEAIANSYTNLATVYLYKEVFDSARLFLNKSMEINLALNSSINLAGNYFSFGEIYFNEKKFNEARKNLEISIEYAKKAESNDILYNDYELLWRVDTAVGDYKQALLHIDQENIYKDLVFKKEKAEAVERMNVLYETEKKDKEIVALNAATEKKNAQNRLLSISLVLAFLILAPIIFFYFKIRQKNNLLAKQKLEVEEKTTELNRQAGEIARFRTQMNPHFMFNALVSIQKSILTEDKKRADQSLTQLSKLMRMTLDNSEKEFISIKDERKFLELYVDFEKMRFSSAFEFDLTIDELIDEENSLIPPMMIQPFIENTIKHGLSPLEKGGHLQVSIFKTHGKGQCLTIEITDNGVGREGSQNAKTGKTSEHKSKGMNITMQRINSAWKDQEPLTDQVFEIKDLYDEHKKSVGTSVVIRLPLTEMF